MHRLNHDSPNAVVLGLWENGYGVIRQLAQAGLKTIGVFSNKGEAWRHSRYLSEAHLAPDPHAEEGRFVQFLLDRSPQWHGALLFPTNDHYVETLSKNKPVLSRYYHAVVERYSVIETLIDKGRLYHLGRSLGIGTPLSMDAKDLTSVEEIRRKVRFPVLLKPAEGHKFHVVYSRKLFCLHDARELFEKIEETRSHGLKMLIQEIIPGPDSNLCSHIVYRSDEGKILFEATLRRERQTPPFYGVSRVARTDWESEVAALAQRVIDHLDYRGILAIEFKRDERDNTWKMLDGNPRFWLPHYACLRAGVNIPYLVYRDKIQKTSLGKCRPRSGVYWINLHEDIWKTFFYKSEEKIGFKDFVRPYFREHVFGDLDFADPFPFLARLYYLAKWLTKKSISRLFNYRNSC